ncbi:LPXTG anchored putative adhesin [Candidatus Nitrosotalea sp. TS]|uniref:transcriptional regulator n=1 Tax=Candidatus Nitrosotalea sp. TS TaxID=2341020 RepID=UPI0014092860|nr:LPXTG anchored putative adhesin [Candidatus Nitrosotalea sp. TS]
MFEKFRKNKDELGSAKEEEGGTAETAQYQPQETEPEKTSNVIEQPSPKPSEQTKMPEPAQQRTMSTGEDIGIGALMDKRNKLEETIDYVGLMIKNLKDKRTNLEKSIEDESVDIKNLKEKLVKVGQYIEEEKQGIKTLQQKRSNVEREADDVATIINNLREKLLSIDRVVNEEGSKIEKFKGARPKSESSFS